MDLSQARDLLGVHWSSFVAAVYDPTVRATPGGVQMFVWQSLNNYYLSRGDALPQGAFGAVNSLLSLAGEQRRAGFSLSQALKTWQSSGLDQAITADHVGRSIDSSTFGGFTGLLQYRVIYQTTDIVDGEPQTSYRTWVAGRDLPESTSGLQSAIEDAAQLAAADYGNEWSGEASPVSILSF